MYTDKITQAVAEAVKQILATEKLHPNQQKLDVHEPEKDELTSNDFKMLRKGKKADVKEANNPFDVKNYKSQLPTKPGELAGFDSKKISTGTVYTRKPVKDEKPMKEDIQKIEELAISPKARADAKEREEDYHDQSEFPVRPGRSLVLHTTSKLKSAYSHHSHTAGNSSMDKPEEKSDFHNATKAMRRLDREFDRRKIPQNKRFAKEDVDINAINGVKMSNVDESSHQAKTTMKHIPNASPELKKAAKDIKPGIAGFRDRVAMLKAGGVKE